MGNNFCFVQHTDPIFLSLSDLLQILSSDFLLAKEENNVRFFIFENFRFYANCAKKNLFRFISLSALFSFFFFFLVICYSIFSNNLSWRVYAKFKHELGYSKGTITQFLSKCYLLWKIAEISRKQQSSSVKQKILFLNL